ncbi:hypothetical protein MMC34_004440 [Xylographa carneopallida]|nr:hypothetical protein [Xylographa carneopallida]
MSHSETGLSDGRINDQIPRSPADMDEVETITDTGGTFEDERVIAEEMDEGRLRLVGFKKAGLEEANEEEADIDSTEATGKEDMAEEEAVADKEVPAVEAPRVAEDDSIDNVVDTES